MIQNKKQIIWKIIKDFLQNPVKNIFPRKEKIKFNSKIRKVYTIIWPRRAWKSYFCFQTINDLLENWINKNQILYFNIENDEVDLENNDDLNLILNTFFEIVSFDKNKKYFIFFDEIQEIENWEKFVRKILDNFENIEIIITGSSSKLLSKEIATSLRWRSLVYEIFPLSFKEILIWNNLNLDFFSTQEQIKFNQLKENFLRNGSFPEIVLSNYNDDIQKILKDYLDLVFYKDIVERNNFKDIKKLKEFRKYLMSFIWDFFSYSKVEKELFLNYRTLQNWIWAFSDSFLIFELKKFSFSIWNQQRSNSKIYLVDNWFYNLLFWHYKEDLWKIFENLVFMELRKSWFIENENIFYFKEGNFDIDFILFKNWKILPIQVCYSLNKENYKREILQLEKFIKKFNLDKWYIVVFEEDEKIDLPENIEILKFAENIFYFNNLFKEIL